MQMANSKLRWLWSFQVDKSSLQAFSNLSTAQIRLAICGVSPSGSVPGPFADLILLWRLGSTSSAGLIKSLLETFPMHTNMVPAFPHKIAAGEPVASRENEHITGLRIARWGGPLVMSI